MRPSDNPPTASGADVLVADEISSLLSPYHPPLTEHALRQLGIYLSLLLKWNGRMSLTAIKDPPRIVRDLFGESFYLATILQTATLTGSVVDVGAGAGFPGLALKLVAPEISVILVESNKRKCTFLKEVIRACDLTGVEVVADRFESWVGAGGRADLVLSRAVRPDAELFAAVKRCLGNKGQWAFFSTTDVVEKAQRDVFADENTQVFPIPRSSKRVILLGKNALTSSKC